MSSRWYPRYVRGNPQLRIFLPDFWMILKKPEDPIPSNQLEFKIPVQMTKYDVRNYLEKIYKIPVIDVKTFVKCGTIKRAPGKSYLIKDDDYKRAVVDLPKDMTFEFPDLFPKEKLDESTGEFAKFGEETDFGKLRERRKNLRQLRHNVPNWFGV